MSPSHRRYVVIEASAGAVVTVILSLIVALLVFHGRSMVPLRGAAGIVADCIPQTMVGGFMCAIMPTLLTRRRLRNGTVVGTTGAAAAPSNAVARALLLAVAATGAGLALHAVLLFGPAAWPVAPLVGWKLVYGAAMGFAVSAVAATMALRDG